MVEEPGEFLRIHAALVEQIQQHAGVDGPAARAHHQAVERGEAHRRGDAAAGVHRAQAGPVAEMGNHDTALRPLAEHFGHLQRDVLVGKSVKAVALDAGFRQPSRQREQPRQLRLGLMELGVEAGDLAQAWTVLRDGLDRSQVVRLVQRRERAQGAQRGQRRRGDFHRRGEAIAAMHHAMARGQQAIGVVVAIDPVEHRGCRETVVGVAGERHGGQRVALRIPRGELRVGAQSVHLAAERAHRPRRPQRE
jgi:hypothetical protein